MKKILTCTAFILSLCCISCTSSRKSNIVVAKLDEPIDSFIEAVERVEAVPLEVDTAHFFSFYPWLFLYKDEIFVIDCYNRVKKSIQKYSSDGSFICEIGREGNGPGEYKNINGFQIINDTIIVFSNPDKLLRYDLNGRYLSSEHVSVYLASNAFLSDNEILIYRGFGSGKSRFSTLSSSGKVKDYLIEEKNNKVLSSSSANPFYCKYSDTIFMTDSYIPHVLSYRDGQLESYLNFDFGGYSIPDKYFQFSNSSDAFDYLYYDRNIPVAKLFRFVKNDNLSVAEVQVSRPYYNFSYGIERGPEWLWFDAGEKGEDSPFSGTFKTLESNALVFLITPGQYRKLPESFLSQLDIDENFLSKDGNQIVLKVFIK